MKNNILTIFVLISIVCSTAAYSSMLIPADEHAKENARAPQNSPVIGDDWDLDRVDFIHYAKPSGATKPRTDACYKLMGVKWLTLPVSYAINPINPYGLSADFVGNAFSAAAETWDAATSKELFADTYTLDSSAYYGTRDYKNVISFGSYNDPNVIAITSVWYTRVGKQIVEFDQLYNTGFVWGDASVDPSVMDLQNIATHELGHAVGLDDIYTSSCGAVTMYGYSTEGDLAKRTLAQPDVLGLQKMYGQ